jgi:beta-phosphoglucomutase-like phosphatase (HAD superfamily)
MKEVLRRTMEAGLKVVVVTGSKQPSLIERLNSDFGIIRENVVSGFDVVNGKPDPEPYLRALEKAGTSAANSIVVENAPLGVRAARAAGLITVAVNTGILKPEDLSSVGASLVLDDTQQLASIWPEILLRGKV